MQCFQHLETSDPRDKINGFRGLHTKGLPLPRPNYQDNSTRQFFEEMEVWLLENTNNLVTLALDLDDCSMKLPSWTPSFSSTSYPIEQNYYRHRLRLYMAYVCDLDLEEQLGPGKGFDYRRPGRLCMKGVQIDEVASVAPDKLTFLPAADHINLLKRWFVFATGREPLSNDDAPFNNDAYCATVLGGHVLDATGSSGWRKASASDYVHWQQAVLESEHGPLTDPYHKLLMASHVSAALQRRLFKTKRGSIAIGHPNVQPGDVLWVFKNGNAAFVTRKVPGHEQPPNMSEQWYTLQGHCYHHGLMQGGFDIAEATIDQHECILV
jgi:hypothetical protein